VDLRPFRDLATSWRGEADLYRKRGLDPEASMTESFAAELEQAAERYALEALTLGEAAAESGYSYSSLQKKVAAGEIENAGKPRRPRIRRKHLPTRPPRPADGPDLASEILSRTL